MSRPTHIAAGAGADARRLRAAAIGAALLAIAAAAAWHAAALRCVVDDAYISFRYAGNLVAGHGLVFNPGERVDGYTNFLWTVLVGAGMACGASAEATSLGLGIASMALLGFTTDALGTAVFAWRWSGRLLALGLLAALGPVLLWCVSGLETGLFAAVVVGALAVHVRGGKGEGSRWLPGLLFGVATLVRPDGALFASVAAVHLGVRAVRAHPSDRSATLRATAAFAAAYALVVVPYWSWRTWYYDALLPNTFYAKTSSAALADLGFAYVRTFVTEYPLFVAALAIGVIAAVSRDTPARSRSPALLLVALVVVWTGYVIRAGGDYMPLARFLVPVLPIGVLLATEACVSFGRFGAGRRARGAVAVALFAGVAGACLLPSYRSAHTPERLGLVDTVLHEKRKMAEWLAVGRLLRAICPRDTTLAVSNAGAIPYCSGLFAIDQSGLCDRYTARVDSDPWVLDYPGHAIQATRAYLEQRHPDLILWRPTVDVWRSQPLPLPPSPAYVTRALRIPDLSGSDGAELFLYLWVRSDSLPRLMEVFFVELSKRP